MSEVKSFWCHEASNILCVRASDFDRVTAERDGLQTLLTAADERDDRRSALTNDDLIAIARNAALNSVHRYNYMPCLPEEAYAWEPHYWVIEAMRAALSPAEPAKDEHVCTGCGSKGWTANCAECVPY